MGERERERKREKKLYLPNVKVKKIKKEIQLEIMNSQYIPWKKEEDINWIWFERKKEWMNEWKVEKIKELKCLITFYERWLVSNVASIWINRKRKHDVC